MITDLLGSDQDQGSDPTSPVNMASPCSTSVHTETTLRSITTDPAEWKCGKFVINGTQRSGLAGEHELTEKSDFGDMLIADNIINGVQRVRSPVLQGIDAALQSINKYFETHGRDRQEQVRSPAETENFIGIVCDKNPVERHRSGYVTDMESSTIGASQPIFSESRRISFMVDPQRMAVQEEKMDQLNQLVHQQRRWTEQILKDLQNEQKQQQESLGERMSAQMSLQINAQLSAQMQSLYCKQSEQPDRWVPFITNLPHFHSAGSVVIDLSVVSVPINHLWFINHK
jgi:hypothetical protein